MATRLLAPARSSLLELEPGWLLLALALRLPELVLELLPLELLPS
jgi:hypothetical protein